jgi:hypothetical protein
MASEHGASSNSAMLDGIRDAATLVLNPRWGGRVDVVEGDTKWF